MTYTIQPGARINVLWAGSNTTKHYRIVADAVDGIAVPRLAEIPALPTRMGIYSPGPNSVSTEEANTPVRLLLLAAGGAWYWLDPTATQVLSDINDLSVVENYAEDITPVALYGEVGND